MPVMRVFPLISLKSLTAVAWARCLKCACEIDACASTPTAQALGGKPLHRDTQIDSTPISLNPHLLQQV